MVELRSMHHLTRFCIRQTLRTRSNCKLKISMCSGRHTGHVESLLPGSIMSNFGTHASQRPGKEVTYSNY
jgi:hypothetical protein